MHIIAVNIEVTIPIDRVIAKPFTGPVPIIYKISAVINVVTFASKIVTKALEKPSLIADCGSFSFNSSRILERISVHLRPLPYQQSKRYLPCLVKLKKLLTETLFL